MKPVKIYIWTACPYCVRAIQLLKKKNVSFQEINLDRDQSGFEALKKQTGHRTVPQIFIGDEFIGGCDDLHALERAGQLDTKLAD
jgi:glutaredoxin 3